MTDYKTLKEKLEQVIDPTFKKPLKEVEGIRRLLISDANVVDVVIALKNKSKDESKVKIEVIKLIKIELGFPGIKISFIDSTYLLEGEKVINYIAIASGKGGVGKSSVTANLAVALTRLGKTVGIIDADVYGASIPHILSLDVKPLEASDDDLMIPLKGEGVEVISTEFFMPKEKPIMWRGPMLGKMLTHYFSGVKWDDNTDFILIDLPPGTGDVAIDVKTYVPSSSALIVTTPHINASYVALKAGLGAIQMGHDIVGVVENMSYFINECNNEREYIFGSGGGEEVAKKLETNLLAQIPIGQPKKTFIYSLDEIQGKMYYKLAQDIIKMYDSKGE